MTKIVLYQYKYIIIAEIEITYFFILIHQRKES